MTQTNPPCHQKTLRDRQYYCPVELGLMMIGGKWKPLILWHLGQSGTLRFGELRKRLPNVTQKMLSQQLREMQTDGLLLRTIYSEVPPKVEYSLTDRGKGVIPILAQLGEWAQTIELSDAEALLPSPALTTGLLPSK